MSTTPTPQPPAVDLLYAEFASLAHKHATVSFLLIGVLSLALVVAGIGGYFGLRAYNAQIAAADQMKLQYENSLKDFKSQLAAAQAQRAQDTAKVQVIERTVTIRDSRANQAILNAVNPSKSSEEVRLALQSVYSDVPSFGSLDPLQADKIVLSAPQAQQITAYKIDRDRLSADLVDTKAIVSLQTGTISSLNNNLAQCTALQTQSTKVIAGYEKAAKKGRLHRFFDGAWKYAGPMVGFALGRMI